MASIFRRGGPGTCAFSRGVRQIASCRMVVIPRFAPLHSASFGTAKCVQDHSVGWPQQYERACAWHRWQDLSVQQKASWCFTSAPLHCGVFREHNALPLDESLVAMLPGQLDASGIGLVNLGTQYADPHQRLKAIRPRCRLHVSLQALPPGFVTHAYVSGHVGISCRSG